VADWGCEDHKKKEYAMSVDARLAELKKKHEALSTQVEKLQGTLSSDDLEITSLKKEKLRLKEEIEKLSHV
jgi:hypothetical protein